LTLAISLEELLSQMATDDDSNADQAAMNAHMIVLREYAAGQSLRDRVTPDAHDEMVRSAALSALQLYVRYGGRFFTFSGCQVYAPVSVSRARRAMGEVYA
jgi:hypothetical protein